jgi:hypothetical protein
MHDISLKLPQPKRAIGARPGRSGSVGGLAGLVRRCSSVSEFGGDSGGRGVRWSSTLIRGGVSTGRGGGATPCQKQRVVV